ncbi:hypothetical protein DRJ75_15070, partial [Enterococcus faecalis]
IRITSSANSRNTCSTFSVILSKIINGFSSFFTRFLYLYSANFQRYKNRVKKEENPLIIFQSYSQK